MFRKRVIIIGFLWALWAALPAWAGRVDAMQGLLPTTLVAGKSTTLRVYFNDPNVTVDRADVTIVRPDARRTTVTATPGGAAATMKVVGSGTDRGVAITIKGVMLPMVGPYFFQIALSNQGAPVQSDVIDYVSLLPTKDVRIGVDLAWSPDGYSAMEVGEAEQALRRMAQLMPIRDGVVPLDSDSTSGLRWTMQVNPQPGDTQSCPFFLPLAFKQQGDHLDTGIVYRWTSPGEGAGGNAAHFCNGVFQHAGLVIYPGDTHYGFSHEFGHLLGSLPDGNNNNLFIDWSLWYYGYDTGKDDLFNVPTNTMYGHPGSYAFWPADWEQLRQQIATLNSTGPAGALWSWNVLHQQAFSDVAVATQPDGRRQLLFISGGDLYSEGELDAAGGSYGGLNYLGNPGFVLSGPVVAVNEFDGRITAFAKDTNGRVHYRTQQVTNGPWYPWRQLTNNPVSGFTIAQHENGRLVAFIVENGSLLQMDQWSPGASFAPATAVGGWGGWGLSGNVTAARHDDGRIQVYVVGGDGHVYSQLQTQPNAAFGGWIDLRHPLTPAVKEIRAARGSDGRLALFEIEGANDAMAVRFQNQPGAALGEPVLLGGSGLRKLRAATVSNGRLIGFALDANGKLLTDFQVDTTRPTVFSGLIDNVLPNGPVSAYAVSATSATGAFDVYTVDANGTASQARVLP